VIVNSSDVVGRAAQVLRAWLPFMLEDRRYKDIDRLATRVSQAIKDLDALELELWQAEGGNRRDGIQYPWRDPTRHRKR
jgi:hypothetical protein